MPGIHVKRMKQKILTPRFLAEAGIIAALYFALTMAVAPLSYGQLGMMQVRISEALCILPFFTPAAIPGLFVGCILANIFSFLGIVDVVFGSLATLAAAVVTYFIRSKWLLPLPSIAFNAMIIGAVLKYFYFFEVPLWMPMLYVGAGQAIACYALGMPLFFLLSRHKDRLFKRRR